jgi:hypothetical protein
METHTLIMLAVGIIVTIVGYALTNTQPKHH